MPDIEHKIHYRGVDWKKVNKRQEAKWAARSSEVTIVKPADPDKLKALMASRPKPKPKPQRPKLCGIKKHDWEGKYKDGWLFIHCLKCKVQNVTYQLSKRELECIENGWWTVNDLYIRVNKKGHVFNPKGGRKQSYKEWKKTQPKNELKECKHKFYMKEEGLVCSECGVFWQEGMD
jgi:hypothetical protein